jgi:hypothetical protein
MPNLASSGLYMVEEEGFHQLASGRKMHNMLGALNFETKAISAI